MTGPRDIHDGIAEWHEAPDDDTYLHDFLGLTWEQYVQWATGGVLPLGCDWYDGDRDRAADARIDKILREP